MNRLPLLASMCNVLAFLVCVAAQEIEPMSDAELAALAGAS